MSVWIKVTRIVQVDVDLPTLDGRASDMLDLGGQMLKIRQHTRTNMRIAAPIMQKECPWH